MKYLSLPTMWHYLYSDILTSETLCEEFPVNRNSKHISQETASTTPPRQSKTPTPTGHFTRLPSLASTCLSYSLQGQPEELSQPAEVLRDLMSVCNWSSGWDHNGALRKDGEYLNTEWALANVPPMGLGCEGCSHSPLCIPKHSKLKGLFKGVERKKRVA